ncbi:MoaD/ThiS family protein [Actinocrinis puniceicyclus]|uniref:MoaD/ThiS family protein n=1 Tax=Actinocrinis puniceicyclus TaxID=977794 RepID=A0A8J8BEG7_9ACTN|nr:MoaD/ThiS family protein [Actinocrinis puniceicyclus]MBS2963729.1 MoaD/ThiS family protein [Actinocrinis puniceicyclus]
MTDGMDVTLHVPGALAGYAGGRREVRVALGAGELATTVSGVLDRVAAELPALERRIRDENAAIRRHVNVYVDGADIRTLSGAQTTVPAGGVIDVIAAVSGG